MRRVRAGGGLGPGLLLDRGDRRRHPRRRPGPRRALLRPVAQPGFLHPVAVDLPKRGRLPRPLPRPRRRAATSRPGGSSPTRCWSNGPTERPARLFAAAVLSATGTSVFDPAFAQALDRCIEHDAMGDHYLVEHGALHRLITESLEAAANMGEPDAFPDDVFLERLYARNGPERRRELQAALCRYELPASPPGASPRLLLAVAGLEDAERLCHAGAWIALSDRCAAEGWTIYLAPGRQAHAALWERC